MRPPAHPAYRRDKFSAERTVGEAPCPLCARNVHRPPGAEPCRPKPRGLLDCQHCYGGRRKKFARGRPYK